ncbi:tetratricopeptide repeat protein [Streptomyces hirsutus]
MEWARRAEDTRLQAALHLRLANTSTTWETPRRPRCTKNSAEQMLEEEAQEPGIDPKQEGSAYEILGSLAED